MVVQAIPTDYAGTRFRSRLEAKWAAFFDLCHWRWSYEPEDFPGYIPDFALWFRVPVLVEVKPLRFDESDHDAEILDETRRKFIRAGIKGEALILGTRVTSPTDGAEFPYQRIGMLMDVDPATDEASPWDWAFAFHCDHCGRFSFASESNSWHCRAGGCIDEYNGSSHLNEWNLEADFKRASSLVQWRPR